MRAAVHHAGLHWLHQRELLARLHAQHAQGELLHLCLLLLKCHVGPAENPKLNGQMWMYKLWDALYCV